MLEGLLNFSNLSNHLILIGIYCLLALSLNLINGSLGVFSLGHHAFWGMGAYAAGMIAWLLGSAHGSLGVFVLSFVVAMAASALLGLVVGLPCLRLRGDYLAIATLGMAEIFIICVRNSESWRMFGERGLGGAAGFSLGDGHHASGDPLSGNDVILALCGGDNRARQVVYLILTWTLVVLTFVLIRNLLRSAQGRAILAIREDETAAELMGINLSRNKVFVFVLGAALAGLAGALTVHYRSAASPQQFVLMEGIKVLLMCVLGGLGSMSGSILAVFILYASEQALNTIETEVPFIKYSGGAFRVLSVPMKDLWQVVFALVLIVLMLLKPSGILGREELSVEYLRERFRRWQRDPWPLVFTLLQWGQVPVVLTLLPRAPWLLYVSLGWIVGMQLVKRWHARRKLGLVRAAGGGA